MPYVQIIIAIVMLIASFAITALTMRRPPNNTPKASTFNDFDFPQAEEGTPQSVVFGDVWIPDYQILWYGNYRNEAIYAGTGGGGKKG